MVKRVDKKIVIKAIKYSLDKWKPEISQGFGEAIPIRLDREQLDRLAFDICDAIERFNGREIKDEQKALDAIRNEGGLMLTQNKDARIWSTPLGTLIALPAAKFLIERGMVKVVGQSLFEGGEPQLYEAAIQ